MLKALSTPEHARRSRALVAIAAALALAAAAVGIDDNPPGLALAFLSVATCTLAFTHPWRSPAAYLKLAGATVAVFIGAVVLHNVFYAMASVPDLPGLARNALVGLEVASFLVGVLVCPPVFVVAVLASAATALTRAPPR